MYNLVLFHYLNNIRVSLPSCHMETSPTITILQFSVGSMIEEELHRLDVILQGHDVQTAPTVRVDVVNVRPVVQQQPGNVQAALQ